MNYKNLQVGDCFRVKSKSHGTAFSKSVYRVKKIYKRNTSTTKKSHYQKTLLLERVAANIPVLELDYDIDNFKIWELQRVETSEFQQIKAKAWKE